ncbi:MAG: DUF169 domain-containing protein [Syntrophomonas sp.]|nr:DUF169 domain-containing protein [Syntrophomonas sp.]
MGDFFNQAILLKDILQLKREPVGVKFVRNINDLPSIKNYDKSRKMRYCQSLMLAGQGYKILLSSQNIACAAAGAAFGLMPLHPKLASGEGHFNTGVLGSAESAGIIMKEMPRLELGTYEFIAMGPLGEVEWVPDVIVIEAPPEALMWVGLAEIYNSGTRLQFTTSVVQASCVDATIVPFLTGKPNGSFGCTGCREASDLDPSEAILGFPGEHLETIITNLQLLQEKVIPKNRNKSICKRFLENK